ncbi:uncharacterized protein LOC135481854 [Liolophura sinensis]|uniref:uncharacterized protein LOC135481854 n=1 Tax=Liolophura sinensis TaxID=3198878 RepID=UPI0031598735
MAVIIPQDPTVYLDTKFQAGDVPEKLSWLNKPKAALVAGLDGQGLVVHSDAKSDFWQKTYYTPTLIADNGHFLHMTSPDDQVVMETSFDLTTHANFDQAGLMVRMDSHHWIKTGMEFADGAPSLSCVVTNGYSDWSRFSWPSKSLSIRVYKQGNSYVMENKLPSSDKWDYFRIAHLDTGDSPVQIGIFTCAPTDKGMSVKFNYLSVKHTDGYSHHN